MISSNPEYSKAGTIHDKLIEELTELIQIMCKAKRFGLSNICPPGGGKPREVGKTNFQLLEEEIADVEERLIEYKSWIQDEMYR